MKKILRRANRGLILAAAAAAGVAVFTLADNAGFDKDKPKLEALAREYLDEVKQVNLAAPSERQALAKTLINEYWCETGERYSVNGALKNEMLNYIDYAPETANITDYVDVERSLTVKKNGFRSAKATIEYDVSMEMDPLTPEFQILGLESGYYYYEDFTGTAAQAEDGSTAGTVNKKLTVNLYFYEKDGKWKLGTADTANTEEV